MRQYVDWKKKEENARLSALRIVRVVQYTHLLFIVQLRVVSIRHFFPIINFDMMECKKVFFAARGRLGREVFQLAFSLRVARRRTLVHTRITSLLLPLVRAVQWSPLSVRSFSLSWLSTQKTWDILLITIDANQLIGYQGLSAPFVKWFSLCFVFLSHCFVYVSLPSVKINNMFHRSSPTAVDDDDEELDPRIQVRNVSLIAQLRSCYSHPCYCLLLTGWAGKT